jgi:hypothetical protein
MHSRNRFFSSCVGSAGSRPTCGHATYTDDRINPHNKRSTDTATLSDTAPHRARTGTWYHVRSARGDDHRLGHIQISLRPLLAPVLLKRAQGTSGSTPAVGAPQSTIQWIRADRNHRATQGSSELQQPSHWMPVAAAHTACRLLTAGPPSSARSARGSDRARTARRRASCRGRRRQPRPNPPAHA